MRRWLAKIFVGAALLACATSIFSFLVRVRPVKFGATFSTIRTQQLNLDVNETFIAVVDDLQLKKIRLPVYWSEVERQSGQLDWSQLDQLMVLAEEHGAKVTLAVGLKVPRWPECFAPDWTNKLSNEQRATAQLSFVSAVVTRYRDEPTLERWQVENEPYFKFGVCPRIEVVEYFEEVDLVRKLDPGHPIIVTTSGEQSWWGMNAHPGDLLGATLYRSVGNHFFGPIVFPFYEMFYVGQRLLLGRSSDQAIIMELQGEPWDDRRNYEAFTAEQLLTNARFVSRLGVREAYWWGVEWWYYLKKQGDSRLWDAAKSL